MESNYAVDGLKTVVTLTTVADVPVSFNSVFDTFSLKSEGDVAYDYSVLVAEIDASTFDYGTPGGYSLAAGSSQGTLVEGKLLENAPVGTYKIKSEIKQGNTVLATSTSTLIVTN